MSSTPPNHALFACLHVPTAKTTQRAFKIIGPKAKRSADFEVTLWAILAAAQSAFNLNDDGDLQGGRLRFLRVQKDLATAGVIPVPAPGKPKRLLWLVFDGLSGTHPTGFEPVPFGFLDPTELRAGNATEAQKI